MNQWLKKVSFSKWFKGKEPPVLPDHFISFNNVYKNYVTPAGEFPALKGLSFSIDAGEFVAIVGKSGSGKTTLLNIITGIDHPTSGEVYIHGQAIHHLNEDQLTLWRGKHIGVVFQFFQLIPTMTVIENVIMPMDFTGSYPFHSRREQALKLLDLVEMGDCKNKLPATISGGQQQRVAIARALANDPPIIVADEPTGNLDSATAESIFQLFKTLAADGKTVIIVTHDDDLADRCDRIIHIADGMVIENAYAQESEQDINRIENIVTVG